MKKCLVFILFFSGFFLYLSAVYADTQTTFASSSCRKDDLPRIRQPIPDWDIIASNLASLSVASSFSGKHLIYSIDCHPSNSKNVVTIDSSSGEIRIEAEVRDQFDITVKAENPCGSVSTVLNVEIDQEE